MMYQEEPVLFNETRRGFLEYSPLQIMSVTSSDGTQSYIEGVDFNVDSYNGILSLTEQSRIPCLTLGGGEGPCYNRFSDQLGNSLFFAEGHVMHDFQACVQYVHEYQKSGKKQTKIEYSPFSLPKARQLLTTKRQLKITLIGDSISCGANASAVTGVHPFRLPYYQILVETLQNNYAADIHLSNFSKGGATSSYALQALQTMLSITTDIAIIAFGMNDATHNVAPSQFRDTIHAVIRRIQLQFPFCEIILIAGLLPNPVWSYANTQLHEAYLMELLTLQSTENNVVVADCHSLSAELYHRKRYPACSGNNINHPNDWMHLHYAKQLSGLFGCTCE